jgi:peptidoglycan/xylan/chitin deacetylase (PgdA/CDA1 family)
MIGAPLVAGALVGGGVLATGLYYPNAPLFGPVIGRGPRAGRTVYLTFDDGPSASATARIVDVLAAADVPAAFFMVGRHARRAPELARAVAAGGHVVGNHTDSHVKLHLRGPRRIRRELYDTHQTLSDLVGPPRCFRAPHGYRNPWVGTTTRALGYRVFGWTYGVFDSACPGVEEIRRRVRVRLRPGAIVLLHDGDGYDPMGDRSQTAAALPGIIRDARDLGYDFHSLKELL